VQSSLIEKFKWKSMAKYLCGNCKTEFDGEDLNYVNFVEGSSVKCSHCCMEVVPTYNFILMKRSLDVCFWSAIIGLVALTFSYYFFDLSFNSYLILFLTPAAFAAVFNSILELQLAQRPIQTIPKINDDIDHNKKKRGLCKLQRSGQRHLPIIISFTR